MSSKEALTTPVRKLLLSDALARECSDDEHFQNKGTPLQDKLILTPISLVEALGRTGHSDCSTEASPIRVPDVVDHHRLSGEAAPGLLWPLPLPLRACHSTVQVSQYAAASCQDEVGASMMRANAPAFDLDVLEYQHDEEQGFDLVSQKIQQAFNRRSFARDLQMFDCLPPYLPALESSSEEQCWEGDVWESWPPTVDADWMMCGLSDDNVSDMSAMAPVLLGENTYLEDTWAAMVHAAGFSQWI